MIIPFPIAPPYSLEELPAFDGTPYVTVAQNPGVLQYFLLPAEWDTEELVDFAVRQHSANKQLTVLALRPSYSIWYFPEGISGPVQDLPHPWLAVDGPVRPCREIPTTEELERRKARFSRFAEMTFRRGRIPPVSPEGSLRTATETDLEALDGLQANGIPKGLSKCTDCGRWKGESLWSRYEGSVVRIDCACGNDTLCAACLEPLAEFRLNTCIYDEENDTVRFIYPLLGTTHFCGRKPSTTAKCAG